MFQYLVIISLIALTFYSNFRLARKENMSLPWTIHLQLVLAYHLVLSLVFYHYIMENGGDSLGYWNLTGPLADPNGDSWGDYFGSGYLFMYWLNYIPYKVWNWTFLTGNLLYALVSFWGWRYLYQLAYKYFPETYKKGIFPLVMLVFYLPNPHFWTAGVGKEALCFWGLAALIFALDRPFKRYFLGLGAFLFLVMVRPYLGWLVLLGFGLVGLLEWKRENYKQKIGAMVALGAAFWALPIALLYSGVEDLAWQEIPSLIQGQLAFLSGEGVNSAVDMWSYSPFLRLFTYWFRPLFWDAHHHLAYFASFENAIYLISLLFLLYHFKLKNWVKMPFALKFGMMVFLLTSMLYAHILGNLGIMMRMKSVYIPFLAWAIVYLSLKLPSPSHFPLPNKIKSKIVDPQ